MFLCFFCLVFSGVLFFCSVFFGVSFFFCVFFRSGKLEDDGWDVVDIVLNNTTRYQRLTAAEKRKFDAKYQAYMEAEMSDNDDPFDDGDDNTDLTYRPEGDMYVSDAEVEANVEIDDDQFDEDDDDQVETIRESHIYPSKPAKYGIKVWWLCDSKSFYPLKGIVYGGKVPGQEHEVN